MANLSENNKPSLGFNSGTMLGKYAGNLPLAKEDLGGKVSKKEADTLRQNIVSGGGLKKAVNLARDYILKGVSFGGFGDRVLGQIGLSVGGKISIKKNSLLGQTNKELFGVHYKKSGFPYGKDELANIGEPTTKKIRDSVVGTLNKEKPSALSKALILNDLTKDLSDKQKEELKNSRRHEQLAIHQVWVIGESDLSREVENLKKDTTKNSQRRLSLIIYKDATGKNIDKLVLPYVPGEFNWSPNNKYVEIAAFGRNVPDYQYLGSSQEFSFEIDWYSNEGNYEKIVSFAKSLDSYSRSNAYNDNPPLVQLTGLYGYDKYYFYIKNAPYRVTEKTGKVGGGLTIYPRQIIQTVTLQRVSSTNPKWETYEIINGNEQ